MFLQLPSGRWQLSDGDFVGSENLPGTGKARRIVFRPPVTLRYLPLFPCLPPAAGISILLFICSTSLLISIRKLEPATTIHTTGK
eukprot:scaffold24026_cov129-Skeletonema_marinoi.AAC.2